MKRVLRFLGANWFKIGCLLLVLFFLSIVKEILVDVPAREAANATFERAAKQNVLDLCLIDAEDSYSSNWDDTCDRMGREANCFLPTHNAQAIETWRKDAKEECYRRAAMN